MMNYLIHSSILLAGVVIFYWLFLKKETFFSINRWTLLGSAFLVLGLPLITIPDSWSVKNNVNVSESISELIQPESKTETTNKPFVDNNNGKKNKAEEKSAGINPDNQSSFSFLYLLNIIYLTGVAIFSFVFVMQMIILLTRRYSLNAIKTGRYNIIELVKEEAPYSFWNMIFINPTIYDPETYEQIMEHEKVHIDQVHFFDKMVAEFMVILFWFNPFAWIFRKSISDNLEFLTDENLIKKGIDKTSYQMSLLKVSVSQKPLNLTTNYNNSFLKNRIKMMNSKKSSVSAIWKFLFIPPLFFLSVITMNAVQSSSQGTELTTENAISEPLPLPERNKTVAPLALPEKKAEETTKSSQKNNQINTHRTSRVFNLDPIHSIQLAIGGDLILSQGNKQEIRIEGPDNLINKINQEVDNGYWSIEFDNNKWEKNEGQHSIKVYVTISNLKAVHLAGSGDIRSTNTLKASNDFDYYLSGSGNSSIDVNVKNNSKCYLSGSGNMTMDGQAKYIDVSLAGSGNVEAINFKVQEAKVNIAGSGNVRIDVSESLSANIAGSGDVEYKGDPKVNYNAQGSGSVHPFK